MQYCIVIVLVREPDLPLIRDMNIFITLLIFSPSQQMTMVGWGRSKPTIPAARRPGNPKTPKKTEAISAAGFGNKSSS